MDEIATSVNAAAHFVPGVPPDCSRRNGVVVGDHRLMIGGEMQIANVEDGLLPVNGCGAHRSHRES